MLFIDFSFRGRLGRLPQNDFRENVESIDRVQRTGIFRTIVSQQLIESADKVWCVGYRFVVGIVEGMIGFKD